MAGVKALIYDILRKNNLRRCAVISAAQYELEGKQVRAMGHRRTGESGVNPVGVAISYRFDTRRHAHTKCLPTFLIVFGLVLVYGFLYPFAALAACVPNATGSGITINCSGTISSSGTLTSPIPAVGMGQSTNNSVINILPGAQINGGGLNITPFSVGNGNAVNIGNSTGGATVASITTNGNNVGGSLYLNGGPNTIEAGANNIITIFPNSSVIAQSGATGTGNGRSEPINVFGFGNTILNYGTLFTNTSSAIFLQNAPSTINSSIPGGGNTNMTVPGVAGTFGTVIMNFGTITAIPNPNATPGTTGQAIAETPQADPNAANANRNVYFANQAGAVVNGNVVMGNGNNTVQLFSGSIINGNLDGGPTPYAGNKDTLILDAETLPGLLAGTLTNFDILTKTGPLAWEITGALSNTRGSLTAVVQQGTLVLSGSTTNFIGTMTVDPGATLQIGNGDSTGVFAHDITDNGTVAFNRSNTLTYSNVISGSGGLAQIGEGTTILDTAQTYTGPTTISDGVLAAGGINVFSPNSDFDVQSGGTLDLRGFNQILLSLTNAGLVITGGFPIGDPNPGTILTVGNYVGENGFLQLNTFLGGDGSPSDELVIDGGTATGSTTLLINNTTGPGAETTANGILVVDVINGGTTAPGAFMLPIDDEVSAGGFVYRLFRGGSNGSDPDSWFLRNSFTVPPEPPVVPPEPPPEPPEPIVPPPPLPPTPPPDPADPPPGIWPIIGPELATYGLIQPIAREMGIQSLGTLNDRIGDTLTWANADDSGAGFVRSYWARYFGEHLNNHYRAFADPRAKGWLNGVQIGVDLWRGEFFPNHRDVVGGYFAYAGTNMDATGLVTNAQATGYQLMHTGNVKLDDYSGAGYWTHYGPSGWYTDVVLQGSGYSGRARTQFTDLPINGSSFISSLEAGYPVPLPFFGPKFVLEPQGQIIYQHVSLDNTHNKFGPISFTSTSAATGRIGVRGQWTIITEKEHVWQPYGRVNLWYDWGTHYTTFFENTAVPLSENSTRLELDGGITGKLTDNLSIYGLGGYEFSVNNTAFNHIRIAKVTAGLRYVC